ncbi:MAG: BBP7 family outer membrane beta-barrel protein [Pirellulales bacterium]|nr:BBP7 family outer membrane beta-barrel protein [Pirellulales bacterium]
MGIHRHIQGLLAAAAVLPWGAQVHGQFIPYNQPQQTAPQAQSSYSTPYPAYQAPAAQVPQAPHYGYGQQATSYGQQPQSGQPVAQVAMRPGQPRYAMAMQNGATNGGLSLTPPAESVAPGTPQQAAPMHQGMPMQQTYPPSPAMQPTPMAAETYGGYAPQGGQPGCNCNGSSVYEGYHDGGYAGYGGCSVDGYGACTGYSTYGGGYGPSGHAGALIRPRGCNYWFGGVYGLLMERDSSDKRPLVFAASGLTAGDYPASNQVVLTTRNVDIGYQGGVEFRLGRTFGGYGDPCSGCCSPPCWGLEAVYWTLFEDDAYAQYVQSGTLRVYSMIDPRGLEYNPGLGYRPLRHYFDYAPPVDDYTNGATLDEIRVDLARVRSTFEVQNLEINLLRLPVGCGGPVVAGVAAAGCTGCDAGGCQPCGSCDAPCAGGCGSRFSCVTLCGFRYMQFDESFMYGVNFTNVTAMPNTTGFMNYNARTTNDLYGFQIGSNGMYRIGCKWGIHLGSAFGLYGNDIDVRQYFDSPTGQVRFIQSGDNFDVYASKTDVSMIGELRLGASYQYSCNCRLYGGWRAIGVTGIALATDQIPVAFIDAAQMNNYVNSNGSLILHGLQAGVEWNY